MKTYAIYLKDDNGWMDGCPDRETVFFGGSDKVYRHGIDAVGGLCHIEVTGYRAACARLRELNSTGDWVAPEEINPEGEESRPTYALAEVSA